MAAEPLLVSVASAALLLDMSRKAILHRIARGHFEAVRIGRRVFLRRADIARLAREGCELPPSETS